MTRALRFVSLFIAAMFMVCGASANNELREDQRDFFESRIRPVLVEHCYACHNSAEVAEGSFALDDRESFLRGGDGGAVLVPFKASESRLLPILRHEVPGMKMPEGGVKLSDSIIADFERWIALGAPDPRDAPPSKEELTQATSWDTVLSKRKQWWSLQPIADVVPPVSEDAKDWSSHPVDSFVFSTLQSRSLAPNAPAEASVLVRRLFFVLIGLPPTPSELDEWTSKLKHPEGYAELVDHLLESPHFGERWARHWMDWIRYADSHGSEGDPSIENGWRYRDYLIRALNQDVPYHQLIREHIAGDLLPEPRINEELGINESMIGPAHWRMVFHGFAPTDALEEKVRFIDDQINTFSKAFLGLTVSCARCHDHKFDAISQKDYYALFGTLASCRPGRVVIDSPAKQNVNRSELALLKPRIKEGIAKDWRNHLVQAEPSFESALKPYLTEWKQRQNADRPSVSAPYRNWDLSLPEDHAQWFAHGIGITNQPSAAGEYSVAVDGDLSILGIYPAGVYSHLLSTKHAGRFTSDRIPLDGDYDLWVQVIGDGGASTRYVVHDYPRNGTVFPVQAVKPEWTWQKFDMTYWNGDEIHIEVTCGPDAPLLSNNESRSWFGIRRAMILKKGAPAPVDTHDAFEPWWKLISAQMPSTDKQLAELLRQSLSDAIDSWEANRLTDAQALLLDTCLRKNLLPNSLSLLPSAKLLIEEYRRLESQISVPIRVPGLEESIGRDQALLTRGEHKLPGELVPRRFLEAIDATPFETPQSGRLQLAAQLVAKENPLVDRVIVNRLWHHLFGRGIVTTPDNFGRLGSEPSHPELLDYLATQFREQGGSLKRMIKLLVLSKTWQLSSVPSDEAKQQDPDNLALSHAFVRRLDAEAVRDSVLAITGSLNRTLYGAPVDGGASRRSIYVRVSRNSLDPFLRAFDFPEPFSCVGRRDATNVPAQSLTLMNDSRVASLANSWAEQILSQPDRDDSQRINLLFRTALARSPSDDERKRLLVYLTDTRGHYENVVKDANKLRTAIEQEKSARQKLLEPARKLAQEQTAAPTTVNVTEAPIPIARWDFDQDTKDSVGTLDGELQGAALVESDALRLGENAYVVTSPITQTLKAKTLEAWIQLDNLTQRGGGVMTIQTRDGAVFDSLVFGEQTPGQWLPGSEFFSRTQSLQGSVESEAVEMPVHVALTYGVDGVVTGYRNGEPYGKPYKSNGPKEFKADEAVISFGVRHLPPGGNRMLSGRILKAQLYDRALSQDEIMRSAQSVRAFVTDSQVIGLLSENERRELNQIDNRIDLLESELKELQPLPKSLDDRTIWADLTSAVLNFKEFIFLK